MEEKKTKQKIKKDNRSNYEEIDDSSFKYVEKPEDEKHKFFPTSFGALLNYITYKSQKQLLNREINDVINP